MVSIFTACINNYKIHTVKPRRRKELPIFCTLLTFILLEKYNFSNKRERAFYYKIQLVNYRWRRQFLYLKIIGVGIFYTFSCEVYSTSGFHRSFFSLWNHMVKTAGTKPNFIFNWVDMVDKLSIDKLTKIFFSIFTNTNQRDRKSVV